MGFKLCEAAERFENLNRSKKQFQFEFFLEKARKRKLGLLTVKMFGKKRKMGEFRYAISCNLLVNQWKKRSGMLMLSFHVEVSVKTKCKKGM